MQGTGQTRLLHVVGARPNFMKLAPVWHAGASRLDIAQLVVHTGQHYDPDMSDRFFRDLDLPDPDLHLAVGSGTHAEQTARIMLALEPVLVAQRPDWVVVYGDVNSTLAAAVVASKLGLPIAHVEAGLRSGDRTMPEEINRLVTDRLATLLLTPSRDADANLRSEGVEASRIVFVGNVMVDTLLRRLPEARALDLPSRFQLPARGYAVVTLHRPANVDVPETLREILLGLEEIATRMPVLFAVHPRTRAALERFGLEHLAPTVRQLPPMGYQEMIGLVADAAVVITDSGGLQEETTVLGVPCLTVRPNTERPVTITEGTNRLVRSTRAGLVSATRAVIASPPTPKRPEGWDGQAAGRILEALAPSTLPPGAGPA